MMRCIAIDDEPLALRQICSYIERTPFLRLAASCRSAVEAAAAMSDAGADLLFVDINMPGLSGLDFVRALPSRPLVIFTTAYSEYALEGFRVDATDYLLKPIGYADFLRSAERAYARFGLLKASSGRRGDDGRSLFVRPGDFFNTEHKRKIAKQYRKMFIQMDGMARVCPARLLPVPL